MVDEEGETDESAVVEKIILIIFALIVFAGIVLLVTSFLFK